MALPVSIPNTFAGATASIPLANLDANFVTIYNAVNGIGNGAEALANVNATGGLVGGTRINPRVVAASGTSGNLTIAGDTTDLYKAEGLTGGITFLQPSGTPVDGQKLTIRLEDNGTARSITWTTSAGAFRAVGVNLPTTTVATKITYVGCIYNATDSFWDVIANITQA